MKIISHLLLVVTIVTLTACESGTGPSKPAGANSATTSIK